MAFRDILIALFVVFLWSTNLIIQKILCQKFSLEFFNVLRFLSCVPLLFVLKRPSTSLIKLTLVAVFWNALNFFFIGLSLQSGMGAGITSVVYQTCSFFGILFCMILIKEIPKKHQLFGMILAFFGVVLLSNDSFSNNINIIGLILVLLAAISWGIGIAFIKKYNFSYDLSTSVWIASIAAIPMTGITYFKGGYELIEKSLEAFSVDILLGILFAAYVATLLAGCIWFWLLKRYSTSLITPYMLLLPLFSCIMSYFMLGERFTSLQIFAFCIILFGIMINQNIIKFNKLIFMIGLYGKNGH